LSRIPAIESWHFPCCPRIPFEDHLEEVDYVAEQVAFAEAILRHLYFIEVDCRSNQKRESQLLDSPTLLILYSTMNLKVISASASASELRGAGVRAGEYLDLSAKAARDIDKRIRFPRIELPGVKKPVLLFRLAGANRRIGPGEAEPQGDRR
jgi:hypothetical protein